MNRPSPTPEAGASQNPTDIWVIDSAGRVCRAESYPAIAAGIWRTTDDPRITSSTDSVRWFLSERSAVIEAMTQAAQRTKEAAIAFRTNCALHHELTQRLECLRDETKADLAETLPTRRAA